jgi:3-phosphoshikimate 1-carboxyvinyltransferase
LLRYDFSDCPDLAQTVAVTCAALGVAGHFTGLESLRIKETDRTAALQTELAPFGVQFEEREPNTWVLQGKVQVPADAMPRIRTYEDHRMAMAFAPLALVLPEMQILEPQVVRKSYPGFWDDLQQLGFSVQWSEAGDLPR